VPNPQGVAFSPDANKLFVASEKGKVYIYDGDSYKQIAALDFEGGADNPALRRRDQTASTSAAATMRKPPPSQRLTRRPTSVLTKFINLAASQNRFNWKNPDPTFT